MCSEDGEVTKNFVSVPRGVFLRSFVGRRPVGPSDADDETFFSFSLPPPTGPQRYRWRLILKHIGTLRHGVSSNLSRRPHSVNDPCFWGCRDSKYTCF